MPSVYGYITELVEAMKEGDRKISICLIGANENVVNAVSPLLTVYDRLYCFDQNSAVNRLKSKFASVSFRLVCIGHGKKTFDSYFWSLQKFYFDLKRMGADLKVFDIVIVAGSNNLEIDAASSVVLDKVLVNNGQIVVHNIDWCYKNSKYWNPDHNPRTKDLFNDEQISCSMPALLCDLYYEDNEKYACVAREKTYRAYSKRNVLS